MIWREILNKWVFRMSSLRYCSKLGSPVFEMDVFALSWMLQSKYQTSTYSRRIWSQERYNFQSNFLKYLLLINYMIEEKLASKLNGLSVTPKTPLVVCLSLNLKTEKIYSNLPVVPHEATYSSVLYIFNSLFCTVHCFSVELEMFLADT